MIFLILLFLLLFTSAVPTSKPINGPKLIASRAWDLKKRFRFYLGSARHPKYGDPWLYTKWQKRAMWSLLDPTRKPTIDPATGYVIRERMWLRNRGGSKTRDGVTLAVFLAYQKRAIMRYNANTDEEEIRGYAWMRVVWYAAGKDQLEQALDYFRESRYVKFCYSQNVHLWNGNKIKIRVATPKQAKSPRADFVFFDEEQDMDKKVYWQILGTMATSPNAQKLHMGTTEVDSQLHDNFLRLEPLGLVIEHHISDCNWKKEEEALAEYAGQPQAIIDSQLYCKWVRPGGLIFQNIEVRDLTEDEYKMILPGKYFGCDPNPKSGHALVLSRYLGSYENPYAIFVEREVGSKELLKWTSSDDPDKHTTKMAKYILGELDNKTFVEIEGQHGEELYDRMEELVEEQVLTLQLHALQLRKVFFQNVSLFYWNEEEKLKRIYYLRLVPKIIISPNCIETARFVKAMAWDPKEPKAKVLKTPDQHFADGFVHGPSAGEGSKMDASL